MGLETRENHEVDYLYEAKNLSNKILEPWKMKYIRESNDKKYDIYTYKLTLWWNKWGIKSKFESQIWKWKEWTRHLHYLKGKYIWLICPNTSIN